LIIQEQKAVQEAKEGGGDLAARVVMVRIVKVGTAPVTVQRGAKAVLAAQAESEARVAKAAISNSQKPCV